jgi:anti-sigma B factor antagonist
MKLKIEVHEKRPGYFEVTPRGHLNTDTAPQLEECCETVIKSKPKGIHFNMAGLDYISSMGLRVVFKTFKESRQQGATFTMSSLQPQIRKVFEIAAALPPQSVFTSVKEADEYFDAMQAQTLQKLKEGQ